MRAAVLDLGTNTFNLLIAEWETPPSFHLLYRSVLPVKLGRGGIHQNIILPEAEERAFMAFGRHMEMVRSYAPGRVAAFATSAFRSAINGSSLARQLETKYGVPVFIIDGDAEAQLIYDGVIASLTSLPEVDDLFAVLDIGGGSNEFIIGNRKEIFWKKSFPTGMARLLALFPPVYPFSSFQKKQIEDYLDSTMKELFEAFDTYRPSLLIGASGAFDTLYEILQARTSPEDVENRASSYARPIEKDILLSVTHQVVSSTKEELERMPGLESSRIEMIGYASLFIAYIFRKLAFSRFVHSEFSLKEGVLWRWMHGLSFP